MSTVVRRVEVTGRVRPVVAWERYADLGAWSTWAPQIRSVEADGSRLAVGRSGVVRPGLLGAGVFGAGRFPAGPGFGVPFVVTAVDAGALSWSWIVSLGPVSLSLHHDLRPDRRGTRAGLVLEGPASLVRTYAPLTRIALARLVRP